MKFPRGELTSRASPTLLMVRLFLHFSNSSSNGGSDDAEIVIRNVSEGATALDVAERINAASSGFEAVIHFYEASIVGFNGSGAQVQSVRIRHSACCHKQVRSGNSLDLRLPLDLNLNPLLRLAHPLGLGVQQNLDAVLPQDFFKFLRDLRVLAGQQLLARMNNRDAAAEASEKLPKLTPM
jgi:hypothetical protein